MSAKRGQATSDDPPPTLNGDWENAFVTHSAQELRTEIAKRRTRGPNKLPLKEQVAIRYSADVLDYFRSSGAGWQTRMDDALREFVSRQQKKK